MTFSIRLLRNLLLPALSFGLLFPMAAPLAGEAAMWSDLQEGDDIAYLLRKSPAQIMRYDLNAAEWMEALSLTDVPSAFRVDDSNIFLASGRKLERIDIDGANKVHIGNSADDILDIVTDGDIVIINLAPDSNDWYKSIDKNSFETIDTASGHPYRTMQGLSIAPSQNRIFGRRTGTTTGDIAFIHYDDDGRFVSGGGSPYHGDYPEATRTWLFPDESKVVDDGGIVYNTNDLTFNNAIGMDLTDIAFHGIDIPIVLVDDELVSFTNTLHETKRYPLERSSRNIVVHDGRVFVFQEDSSTGDDVRVEIVDLDDLSAGEPGEPVSPIGLEYVIDDSAIDPAGTLYLLSKSFTSVFRWDVEGQEYLGTIALPEPADLVVYAEGLHRLYVYASSRKIYRINLDEEAPAVVHHATTPSKIDMMIPLGDELFALRNGSWDDHWIYDEEGYLVKSEILCCSNDYHFYDAATRDLYYDSYKVEYLGNGEFGDREGRHIPSFRPLALSFDGQLTIDADGVIYRTENHEETDSLSNDILRARWNSDNQLFTEKNFIDNATTTVQRWSGNYARKVERRLAGESIAFYVHGENLVVVTDVDGTPSITVLRPDLRVFPPDTLATPVLGVARFSATSAALVWERIAGTENYVIERRSSSDSDWTEIASLPFDATSFTDVTLVTGETYAFRIKATNIGLESGFSEPAEVDLTDVVDDRADPRVVTFTPDDAVISADDVIYLLAGEEESIFVWDAVAQDWRPTIPLNGSPERFTYSEEHDALYTLYNDGTVNSIGLWAENPVEIGFAQVGETHWPEMMATGEFLIVGGYFSSFLTHASFDAAGNVIDQSYLPYVLGGPAWNPENRQIYYLRDRTSPNNLVATGIDEDGIIGLTKESPDRGTGIEHPVRVDPAGTIVILGSGRIYDADSLEHINSLANDIDDAVWVEGQLLTLAEDIIFSHSGDNYASEAGVSLLHTGLRIFPTSEGDLAVISQADSGEIVIDVFGRDFEIVAPATLRQPTALFAAIEVEDEVTLSWANVAGENGYRIERRAAGLESWETIGVTGFSITTFIDTDVAAGGSYDYRVVAFNGLLESDSSAVLSITVSAPEAHGGFTATSLDGYRIKLEWERAQLASGYSLERQQAGSSSWTLLGRIDAGETTHTDSDLLPDTSYEYRMRAVNAIGNAAWTFATARTALVPPGRPSLQLPEATPFSTRLSWSQHSLAEETIIERQDAGSGEWIELVQVPAPVTRFVDESVEAENSYIYRIKSMNEAGESPYSDPWTVEIPVLEAPEAPSLSRPYPATHTSLVIHWQSVDYVNGYQLEYRVEGADAWEELTVVGPRRTSYEHTGLITGLSYEYRLKAWNDAGTSPYSTRTGSALELMTLLKDDFEPEENHRMWYRISGGEAVDGGDGFDRGSALWFGGGDGFAETRAVDARNGGFLHFSVRAGNAEEDGEDYWRNFTALKNLSVQYSTDGRSWSMIQEIPLNYPNLRGWTNVVLSLPSEARSATTRVRWFVEGGDSAGNWALDNVEMRAETPAPVPWVDYVQASVLNAATVHLAWPSPMPSGVDSPLNLEGVYLFQVERRVGGRSWEVIGLVEGEFFPVYIDYAAPAGETLFYRVRTLAPWDEALPSMPSAVATISQLDEWRMANFGTTTNTGASADMTVDGFGVANIQRYAFGFEAGEAPRDYEPGSGASGMPAVWLDSKSNRLNMAFLRRKPESNPEIQYVVEFSKDLVHWRSTVTPVEATAVRGNWEEVRFEQPPGFDVERKVFTRIRIVRQ